MSLIFSHGFRGLVAIILATLALTIGVHPAWAGADDQEDRTTSDPSSRATQAPVDGAPTPRLQLQDEEPPATPADSARLSSRSRARVAVADDVDERPFWKSWIFWAVTGALVVGAVGLAAYSSTHSTSSSLAPCPVGVALSLGCFGAGRGQ